ncbi:MAG: mechanosensitive ion channel family protein [Deltaproteobacteria bacterium]|nr:mechanosensitive ion channel family protein [Deltaproteobacteria bacterium]MBW2253472.1 mechanosensitive ion channel family protein [Deltaproteobacteria bacterium]
MGSILWLLIYALLIIGAGYVVGSWLGGLTRITLERGRLDPAVRHLVVSLVKPLVVILAFVAALNVIGVDLTGVIAVLGAATLAVGFALRDSLANVAAGALLLTLRPFSGGDLVEAGGSFGTVTELGLFTTGLKTAQGVHVYLPNSIIIKGPIQNYSRNGLRRADVRFRVASNADLGKAKKALLDALASDERILKDPEPLVLVSELDERGIDLLVGAWFKNEDFGQGRSELVASIRNALKTARIQLATDAPVVVTQ